MRHEKKGRFGNEKSIKGRIRERNKASLEDQSIIHYQFPPGITDLVKLVSNDRYQLNLCPLSGFPARLCKARFGFWRKTANGNRSRV